MLDFGRVEDIAEIAIDDMSPVILPWPPYRHEFKLSSGLHSMRITVTNAPGNMFRNAALPAGLIGPVSCRNTDDRGRRAEDRGQRTVIGGRCRVVRLGQGIWRLGNLGSRKVRTTDRH